MQPEPEPSAGDALLCGASAATGELSKGFYGAQNYIGWRKCERVTKLYALAYCRPRREEAWPRQMQPTLQLTRTRGEDTWERTTAHRLTFLRIIMAQTKLEWTCRP